MRTKFILTLALIFCMSAFYVSAYAAVNNSMIVNAELLDNDTIRIDVNDGGSVSSLAVRLSDYEIDNNSQYISIQAVNLGGNQSDIIQIRNPNYASVPVNNGTATDVSVSVNNNQNTGPRPFTPDGTGTVIDNVTDGDGKEFFTIFTEDGNEFFLVIDRHRSVDNVYLLNAVTEQDLISLAQQAGNEISRPPVVTTPTTPDEDSEESSQATNNDPPTPPQSGGNRGNMIFIIIAAIAVGGVGYYIKVIRPKQQSQDSDDFYDEDEDEDYIDVDGDDYVDDGKEDVDKGGDDE